jgi:hypothetical protein
MRSGRWFVALLLRWPGGMGSGSTRTTGLGGVGTAAATVGAGEAGGGWDGIADGFRASGSRGESEGDREGGGEFGAAMGAAKSRLVVSATAMATGGGAIGPVCAMVICTVEIDAGTTVICGGLGAGGAGGGVGICWGGGPPCKSSFFCSSVAIRVLIRPMLCRFSSGLPMRSL